jgi:5-oxoprolinase (ATP-hydrolysing)
MSRYLSDDTPCSCIPLVCARALLGLENFPAARVRIRELEFLEPLQVSILSEVREFVPIGFVKSNPSSQRRTRAPYGLEGGGQGGLGRNIWIKQAREEDGDVAVDGIPNAREINIGGKATIRMGKGDRLRIETPGGGGWGLPGERRGYPVGRAEI